MLKQAEALFARIKEAGIYDYDKIYKAYEYGYNSNIGVKK